MSWDVFAGDIADELLAVFLTRAVKDGVQRTRAEIAAYFRSHLERGIMQLQGAGSLGEFFKRACEGVCRD